MLETALPALYFWLLVNSFEFFFIDIFGQFNVYVGLGDLKLILADFWTLFGRVLIFYLATLHYSFVSFSFCCFRHSKRY